MKCFRASPYGKLHCELDKGHEGECFDGTHHFTESIDGLGRDFILDINKAFELNLQITEENTKKMSDIVDDNIDGIIDGHELGYCGDCDQRMPDEPMINEGYL